MTTYCSSSKSTNVLGTGMQASVESIGPDEAKQMLRASELTGRPNFRKLDPLRVKAYSHEMAVQRWELNGETIKIDRHGYILDGQHRLHAIIAAGVTVRILVVRGVESDYGTIDRGKPRSIGQWAASQGFKSGDKLAATARLCVLHDKGLWSSMCAGSVAVPDSDVKDYIATHHENLLVCIRLGHACKALMPASMVACVLHIGCGCSHPDNFAEARWFASALATGKNVTPNDGVFHLRNRMINQSPQAKIPINVRRFLLTLAWNKMVRNEPCINHKSISLRLVGDRPQTPPKEILVLQSDTEPV